MHRAFVLIFHIQHLWPALLAGYCSNFVPFEEVKVPVSNSAEFFQRKCPLEDFGGFGVVKVSVVVETFSETSHLC